MGLVSLLDVSGWLFGGVVQGHVLPTSVALAGLVSLVSGYAQWLRRAMVVDRSRHRSASGGSSEWLDRLARRGPAWREAVLEVRLLWRNSQTRMSAFTTALLPIMVTAFAFFPFELADLRSMSGAQLLNATLFPGLFTTGVVAISHGQNLFSYEGISVESTDSPSCVRPHLGFGQASFSGSRHTGLLSDFAPVSSGTAKPVPHRPYLLFLV